MEIKKIIQADVIIYHIPIWWMHLLNRLKKYLDEVLNTRKEKGI
ncbi:NAD(P)H-dependent oxidoreductase [Pedobacter sp. AK013]